MTKVVNSSVGEGEQYKDVVDPAGGETPLRYLSADVLSPWIAKHAEDLLQLVRFPFITTSDLKYKLDEADWTLLKAVPVFAKLMEEAISVQFGRRAGASRDEKLNAGSNERCRKRARYDEIHKADVTMLVVAFMGTQG